MPYVQCALHADLAAQELRVYTCSENIKQRQFWHLVLYNTIFASFAWQFYSANLLAWHSDFCVTKGNPLHAEAI